MSIATGALPAGEPPTSAVPELPGVVVGERGELQLLLLGGEVGHGRPGWGSVMPTFRPWPPVRRARGVASAGSPRGTVGGGAARIAPGGDPRQRPERRQGADRLDRRRRRPRVMCGEPDPQPPGRMRNARGGEHRRLPVDARRDRLCGGHVELRGRPLPPRVAAGGCRGCSGVDDRDAEERLVERRAGAGAGGAGQPVLVVADEDHRRALQRPSARRGPASGRAPPGRPSASGTVSSSVRILAVPVARSAAPPRRRPRATRC